MSSQAVRSTPLIFLRGLKTLKLGAKYFFASLICLLSLACSKPEPVVVPEPEPPMDHLHEVKYSGETLGLISRWYTGETDNWALIAESNPGLNPNRIFIGQFISIPEALVTRTESLPKRLVPKPVVKVNSKVEEVEAPAMNKVSAKGTDVKSELNSITKSSSTKQGVSAGEEKTNEPEVVKSEAPKTTSLSKPVPVSPESSQKDEITAKKRTVAEEIAELKRLEEKAEASVNLPPSSVERTSSPVDKADAGSQNEDQGLFDRAGKEVSSETSEQEKRRKALLGEILRN